MHTRFHKLADCLRRGVFDIIQPGEDLSPRQADKELTGQFEELLGQLRQMPLFTIDDEAMRLITPDDCKHALSAQVEAGIVHLPFPRCLFELNGGQRESTQYRDFGFCWEYEDKPGSIYVQLLSYVTSGRTEVAALWPVIVKCTPNADGTVNMVPCYDSSWREEWKELSEKVEKEFSGLAKMIGRILAAALVLMFTRGIAREKVVAEPKLQKARKRSGKEAIPTYVHVKIGTFYDQNGKEHKYDPTGRKMPIHLRRAHNRHVAVGKGRTGRELRHFPAVIVNYKPADDAIVMKHYGVTA